MRIFGSGPTFLMNPVSPVFSAASSPQGLQGGADTFSSAAGGALAGTQGLLKKYQEQRRSLMNAGATLV